MSWCLLYMDTDFGGGVGKVEWGIGVGMEWQVVWVETVSSQLANHGTKVILWNCLTHRRSSWLA